MKSSLWARYVHSLRLDLGMRLGEFAAHTGIQQPTYSRWEAGKSAPTSAADVAHFARTLERNPLEAFVAAGMLTEDEAGRGLDAESRELLARLRGRRAPRKASRTA